MRSSANSNNTMSLPITIPVLDPMCKAGFIHIPVNLTGSTKGKSDWMAAGGCLMRDLSVCCLHQDGKCRAAAACRQIHCDRSFIAAERSRQATVVSCCLACGDTMSVSQLTAPATNYSAAAFAAEELQIRLTGPAACGMPELPFDRLAFTAGVMPYITSARKGMAIMEVPWTAVCRLHLKSQCKFGKDCKNVHVCCQLGKQLLATAAVTVNPVVPSEVRSVASTPMSVRGPSATPTACATPLRAYEASPAHTPAAVRCAAPAAPEESLFNRTSLERQASTTSTTSSTESATLKQPRAPAQRRANFPRLDEGSLQLRDADLDGLVFNLPTIASSVCSSNTRGGAGVPDLCDIFGLNSPGSSGSPNLTAASLFNGNSPTAFLSPVLTTIRSGLRAR